MSAMTPAELRTSLDNLKLERDAITLYDQLAKIEKDPRRSGAFRTISSNERRHADIWARRLGEAGVRVPPFGGPRLRVRFIITLARVFGTRAVSDLVQALEGDEEEAYADQTHPEVAGIAADEREHAAIWRRLAADDALERDADGPAERAALAAALTPTGLPGAGAASRGAGAIVARGRGRDAAGRGRQEHWHHRAARTGTLRAAIFGVNDGLVSNLSLVMGVAGAAVDNHLIVLAGVAGMLAGAASMGAGEWISMQSQRELFERQIEIEREELRIMPDVEEAELAGIYREKGLGAADADRVANNLMRDPAAALDTKVREELGLDPDQLGSPWGAAVGSFIAFGIGALVPLLPFLLGRGPTAMLFSLTLAFAALFTVGAGVSLLTGRSALFSGLRQVAIGAGAAALTYAVGSLIGVGFSA